MRGPIICLPWKPSTPLAFRSKRACSSSARTRAGYWACPARRWQASPPDKDSTPLARNRRRCVSRFGSWERDKALKLGIMIEGQEGLNWENWRQIARATEDLGFESL